MDKPLVWMGQTLKDLRKMPEAVQHEFGYALGVAQRGGVGAAARPMKANLRDVMEVVTDEDGDTYRAMYTTKLEGESTYLTSFKRKPSRAAQLRRLTWTGSRSD